MGNEKPKRARRMAKNYQDGFKIILLEATKIEYSNTNTPIRIYSDKTVKFLYRTSNLNKDLQEVN